MRADVLYVIKTYRGCYKAKLLLRDTDPFTSIVCVIYAVSMHHSTHTQVDLHHNTQKQLHTSHSNRSPTSSDSFSAGISSSFTCFIMKSYNCSDVKVIHSSVVFVLIRCLWGVCEILLKTNSVWYFKQFSLSNRSHSFNSFFLPSFFIFLSTTYAGMLRVVWASHVCCIIQDCCSTFCSWGITKG